MMTISELLRELQPHQRRGSKARCHLLTHGDRATVADRLSMLLMPYGHVRPFDYWLPNGFLQTTEAKLGETTGLLSAENREAITAWWLAVRRNANTPNWDITGTCEIGARSGIFLVEAKAHLAELRDGGKDQPATENGVKNHGRIGQAIADANAALNETIAGWSLSRDSHYQLANRVAWSWKLASLGVPVVLVYLGFLCANEMVDRGPPIRDAAEWTDAIHTYSGQLMPVAAWGTSLDIVGTPMIAVIRTASISIAEAPNIERDAFHCCFTN